MVEEGVRIYGPYLRKDGRKHVILIDAVGNRRTVSYPRWLMEQKLGHEVPVELDVHHENEDFTDDSDDNLKLKLHTEHCSDHSRYPTVLITIICARCSSRALKRSRNIRSNQYSKKRKGPFCSRHCAGKASNGM